MDSLFYPLPNLFHLWNYDQRSDKHDFTFDVKRKDIIFDIKFCYPNALLYFLMSLFTY